MELGNGLAFQLSADRMIDVSSADSESRFFCEMLEAHLEIIRRERHVSIELHQKIPVITLARIIPVVKRFHHAAAGLPEASVCSMHYLNPWVLSGIAVDHRTGLVGGAVVNDDPFLRPHRLAQDTFNGSLDVPFLVAHRSDDHISRHFFRSCPLLVKRRSSCSEVLAMDGIAPTKFGVGA